VTSSGPPLIFWFDFERTGTGPCTRSSNGQLQALDGNLDFNLSANQLCRYCPMAEDVLPQAEHFVKGISPQDANREGLLVS